MKYEFTDRAACRPSEGGCRSIRPPTSPPPLVLRSQGRRGIRVVASRRTERATTHAFRHPDLRAGIRGGADTRRLLCRRKPRASAANLSPKICWLRNQTLTTVQKRLTGLFTHGEYSEPSRRRDRGMSFQRVITWFLGVPQSQPQLAYEAQELDVGPIAVDIDTVTSILKGRRQRRRRTTFRGFHSPPGRF
jgi:hypothetical protein